MPRPIQNHDDLQGQSMAVQVIVVDPSQGIVQGRPIAYPTQLIQILVFRSEAAFRWPIVGERWIICFDKGHWYLVGRAQNPSDEVALADIPQNTVRLDGDQIKTTDNKDAVLTKGAVSDQNTVVYDQSSGTWNTQQVGTPSLADLSITESKLAANSVTPSKIAANAITAPAIAAGAVGSSAIASGAVGNTQLASGSVDSSKLAAAIWTNLTLQNSWTTVAGSPTPAYFQNGSFVVLRGGTAGGAIGTAIATLPVGLRPVSDQSFSVVTGASTAGGLIVHADGTIVLSFGNTTFLSLDGIRVSL